jgi:hypothetical protein
MDHFGKLGSWDELYVMLGSSSAALIGLLFVATSLHLDEIVNNVSYRTRARNNSYTLIFTLVEAAIILTPQPIAVVSVALVLTNLAMLWFPIKNVYLYTFKNRALGIRGGWTVWRSAIYFLAFVLGITGGALVLSRPDAGLFLVTTGYVIVLVNVVLNSWSIMIGVGQREKAVKKKQVRSRRRRS